MGKINKLKHEPLWLKHRLSSLTMDPVWSRPVSPARRPHVPSSLLSSEDPRTHLLCRASSRRTATSVRRLTKREVSLTSTTQLPPVLLSLGTIWKRSGTTPSTTSSELPHPSLPVFFSLRPHVTPRLTVKRWLPSCSRLSRSRTRTSPFRPSCPFTPPEEPPVSLWTLVMVSPIPSQSSKVSPCHTLLREWRSLDVSSPTSCRSSSSSQLPRASPPLPSSRSSRPLRKTSLTLPPGTMKRRLRPPTPPRTISHTPSQTRESSTFQEPSELPAQSFSSSQS